MARVTPAQILAHIRITLLPERHQVAGDRHRPFGEPRKALAVGSALGGLALAWQLDVAPGGMVALTAVGLFFVAFAARRGGA